MKRSGIIQRAGEWLGGRGPGSVCFASLFVGGLLYRVLTIIRLAGSAVPPLSTIVSLRAFLCGLRYLTWDLDVAAALAAAVGLLAVLCGRLPRGVSGTARRIGWATLGLALGGWGLVVAAHHELIFTIHSGLTTDLIAAGLGGSTAEFLGYASWPALCLLAVHVAVPLLIHVAPPRFDAVRGRMLAILCGLVVLGNLPSPVLWAMGRAPLSPNWALKAPPVLYLADDAVDHLKVHRFVDLETATPEAEHRGMHLVGPMYEGPPVDLGLWHPGPPRSTPWNVLVVILESTSSRRAFEPGPTTPPVVPMPFLRSLAESGLWLTRHQSAANSSSKGIFALFTGLNPMPDASSFASRPDLAFPGLPDLLGADYDAFLVTPGRVEDHFPTALVRHMGMTELHDLNDIPASPGRPASENARNELDAVDFLLARLERARPPFFATYYSGLAHYPYPDHGPEHHIAPNLDDPLHRYLNGLRVLDTQLERIVGALRARGQLDDTVILLVGDHGEAFGEHPDNWAHVSGSFQENVQAPAIFWQPRLFPPARVQVRTSHVDLLPTLLDALGLPVGPDRFQGESLYGPVRRRYLFSYGVEGTLSSLDEAGHKLQILYRQDVCRVFDLARDPEERSPQSCDGAGAQLQAAVAYRHFQRRMLPDHNAELTRAAAAPGPLSEADCLESALCRGLGRCHAIDGQCRAAYPQDCKRLPACTCGCTVYVGECHPVDCGGEPSGD